MSKHWNDVLMNLEKYSRDNLTNCQNVGMERWDMRWEIERLEKLVAEKDKQIGSLRFDVAILKAELNSVRGRKCLED